MEDRGWRTEDGQPRTTHHQPPPLAIRFDHLTPDDGLSQSVIESMTQDALGFMWFGTQDGLNRYDGYGFKVFRAEPGNPRMPSANIILALTTDATGKLWLGTNGGGLNCYDPQTGLFTDYRHDPANPRSLSENCVTCVHVDRRGQVWAGTGNNGLNVLNPQTGQVTRFFHHPDDPHSLSANTLLSLAEDAAGALWVATVSQGLNRLDPRTGRITRYRHDPADPASLGSDHLQTLHLDRQGTLWIATCDAGLDALDPRTGRCRHYPPDPANPTGLGHPHVKAMCDDRAGRLWVGTDGKGLYCLDPQTGQFTHYERRREDSTSLSSDHIWSIFEDQSGVLWFGTFGAGVDRFDPAKTRFQRLQGTEGPASALGERQVWAIHEDRQATVWIGTDHGGLYRYDSRRQQWGYYELEGAPIIRRIYQDRAGWLWLGASGGLVRFHPDSERFEKVHTPGGVIPMCEDHLGRFWLGSVHGLLLLDPKTGVYQSFKHNPADPHSLGSDTVSAIVEDRDGALWLGSINGGLDRFDPRTGRCVHYRHRPDDPTTISDDVVLALHLDRDGILWLGTTAGLNRLDPRTGKAVAYRQADGLPNDMVYSIVEDRQGYLWVGTNRGMARFDPRSLEVKRYTRADGLQDNEFNQGAAFASPSGKLYFGGIHGLNVFDPADIHDNPFIPPIVFTAFELFHKPVPVGPDSPLRRPVEVTREIRLTPSQTFFQVEYAALHYASPQDNQYAYKLEGLDPDWNYVGHRRFASYTNVPPGEYTLRVKGANSDGVWNETGASLKIVILPHVWQTRWFRLLGLAGATGGVYAAATLRLRTVEAQRQRLERQVDERTHELRETMSELERSKEAAEAANKAKSTFLANMSHELRTPLNAILGFVQILRRDDRLEADQRDKLDIIHRSGEHLLGLINDVLEMSKIEAGRVTLKTGVFDLHRLLGGLTEMFGLRAERKSLALGLDLAPDAPRYLLGDEGKLRQVLMNLLGNAVKFTQRGSITLRVTLAPSQVANRHPEQSEGSALQRVSEQMPRFARHDSPGPSVHDPAQVWLRFAVEDTGPGIAPDEVARLFAPFVQTQSGQQAQEGTGLGLSISQQYARLMGGEIRVQSQVGQGSVFTVELPFGVVEGAATPSPIDGRRVVGLEPGQPAYRLLVVDDREENRALLVSLLSPLGFEVREAANGQEALDVWQTWEPQLIWMDMRMPIMDGFEATRRIKATPGGEKTVIVALTASAMEEERTEMLAQGCDDYLRKPYRAEDLYAVLSQRLGVRFIYEETPPGQPGQGEPPTMSQGAGQAKGEIVARLAVADPAWLADLERATLLGDQEAILGQVSRVAGRDEPLAAELTALANAFDHDRILALLQHARRDHADRQDA